MYYTDESSAAKDLLYRRSRALADYQHANRALDKARAKQRDISSADQAQATSHKRFNDISDMARRGAFSVCRRVEKVPPVFLFLITCDSFLCELS